MSEKNTDNRGGRIDSKDLRNGVAFTHEAAQSQAAAAIKSIPSMLKDYSCPICNRTFAIYADLQHHYAAEHPDVVVPVKFHLMSTGRTAKCLLNRTGLCSISSSGWG